MPSKHTQEEINPRDRFVTLRGDPINIHPAVELLTSNPVKATGLATAFTAVMGNMLTNDPNELTSDIVSQVSRNFKDIIINRYLIEKIILNRIDANNNTLVSFISGETLKKLCIDKNPDPETSMNSLSKYGQASHRARTLFGFFSAVSTVCATTSVATGLMANDSRIIMNSATHAATDLTFCIGGLHRFNKVVKGEWAITDTPSPDKIEQMQEDYNRRHKIQSLTPGFSR